MNYFTIQIHYRDIGADKQEIIKIKEFYDYEGIEGVKGFQQNVWQKGFRLELNKDVCYELVSPFRIVKILALKQVAKHGIGV